MVTYLLLKPKYSFFILILFIKLELQNWKGTKAYAINSSPQASVPAINIISFLWILPKALCMYKETLPFLFYTNGCIESIVFKLKWKSKGLYRILTSYMNTLLSSIKKFVLKNKFIFNSSPHHLKLRKICLAKRSRRSRELNSIPLPSKSTHFTSGPEFQALRKPHPPSKFPPGAVLQQLH